MAINNGQPVDAANSNAAWMSRTVDTDTIGKVDLKEGSSPQILDVQSQINTNITDIATNTADIATNAANIASNDTDISNLQATAPTSDEKDALAGTSGAPSTSNKYVTDADPRLLQSNLEVLDETVSLTTQAKKIDFQGTAITVTEPVADELVVTVNASSPVEVQDESVSLTTAVKKLDFQGAGVTVTEPVADEVVVTIPGGGGGSAVENLIINGNFDFWQRGTSVNLTLGQSTSYQADRFKGFQSTSGTCQMARNTAPPTQSESGFASLYALIMSTTVTGTIGAGDNYVLSYKMEGHDFANIYGKQFTLSFWAKSTETGTFAVAFRNNAQDRNYVTEYTIDTANTWEKKTITVTHDATGTWELDEQTGMEIMWDLGSGTNFQTGTTDTWQAGNSFSTSNVVNMIGTINAAFLISQVQIEEGGAASDFVRAGKSIGNELELCERFYEKSFDTNTAPSATFNGAGTHRGSTSGSISNAIHVDYRTKKRATATMTPYSPGTGASGNIRNNSGGSDVAASSVDQGDSGANISFTDPGSNSSLSWQWTADAEL